MRFTITRVQNRPLAGSVLFLHFKLVTCRNDIHEFLLVNTKVSAGGPDSTYLAQRRDKWQGLNCSLLKVVQVPVFVYAFINSFTHTLIQTGGAHEALPLQGRDSVQVHQTPES